MSSRQGESIEHDYSKPYWGHDVSIIRVVDGGQQLRVCGWGHGLSIGEYLILPNSERTTRYRIGDDLSYYANPKDMWKATLHFAPREAGHE